MRNDVMLGGHQVTLDSGHYMPGGSPNPVEKAGTIRRAAACVVLIAAAISVDMATSAWGVRERVLLVIVAILAVIVGLLLRRHRLSDQRLAAERLQLSI